MFSRPSGVGCASGCDDGVAGVVAWLLVHGQVADVVSSVSSRRCRLVGRDGERTVFAIGFVMVICPVLVPLFRLGCVAHVLGGLLRRVALVSPICLLSLPRLVHRLVFHLVGRLVVPALPSMCFSCVFPIHSPASCACLIYPRTRLVQSSRHLVSSCVSWAAAGRHVLA